MKTLNAIFSIAAIALCCSTAAYAEQNASAKFTAVAPSGYEELVITARRGQHQDGKPPGNSAGCAAVPDKDPGTPGTNRLARWQARDAASQPLRPGGHVKLLL